MYDDYFNPLWFEAINHFLCLKESSLVPDERLNFNTKVIQSQHLLILACCLYCLHLLLHHRSCFHLQQESVFLLSSCFEQGVNQRLNRISEEDKSEVSYRINHVHTNPRLQQHSGTVCQLSKHSATGPAF